MSICSRSTWTSGRSQSRCNPQVHTKRASPASTNGLVVNHSHMNALVVPSFTESIRPRISLLTEGIYVSCREVHRNRWRLTFELHLGRIPALLQAHDVRHGLAPAGSREGEYSCRSLQGEKMRPPSKPRNTNSSAPQICDRVVL